MNRRKFFSNLVGSVSVLVSAYALPFQKVTRQAAGVEQMLKDGLIYKGFEGFDVYWHKTPLTRLFKKLPFPDNMGKTIRTVNYDL